MKRILSTTAVLIACLLCGYATAGNFSRIDGSDFKAGEWVGQAFKDNTTGKWEECGVSNIFDRFQLTFALSRSGFVIYLGYDTPLFEDMDCFQIVSQVDRYESIFLTAYKWNDRYIRVAYDDFDAIYFQLKKGNRLKLSSRFLGDLEFNLRGSSRALEAAYDCAARYEDYHAPLSSNNGSATNSSNSTLGAIALSENDGATGYSYDYERRFDAEKRALQECQAFAPNCVLAVWFENECGALALGDDNGWGASTGYSIIEAEKEAISTCRSYDNTNCQIEVSLCSYD